ncbi:hypothetical protein CXR04_29770 [Streptomyces sp. CMB-StM0423]|nr:hypothetical protein CXR04_29770 [Streptomyces sp. CMB-StM0423]
MLAAVVAASVALPVAAAARPAAVPAPVPDVPFDVGAGTPAALAQRYAANRDGIRAAAHTAAAHGDRRRADSLRAMAAPGRRFVSFDGRDGGRSAEVFGDLAHAGRIAVLVPGSDTGLDAYGRFRAGAEALRGELHADPADDGPGAVVAWLGYATPSTVSPESLTADRAEAAAPRLREFVRSLTAARPGARVSLLCHSYGSVVCGRAAAGLRVADIVLYASPGVGADTAADLRTPATVWAGRGADDWVGEVPHVRIPLLVTTLGFGRDPVSPAFGACPFPAGTGGHSDYLTPGSVPLRSMAGIVKGEAACARPGAARPPLKGEAAGPGAAVTADLPCPYLQCPGPAARPLPATALPQTPRSPFPYAQGPALPHLRSHGRAHA